MDLRPRSPTAQEPVISIFQPLSRRSRGSPGRSGDGDSSRDCVGFAFKNSVARDKSGQRGRYGNSIQAIGVSSTKEIKNAYHNQFRCCCCACARLCLYNLGREPYPTPPSCLRNGKSVVAKLVRRAPGCSTAMELCMYDRSRPKPVWRTDVGIRS